MDPGDWPDVERIYGAAIASRQATFETTPPAYAAFDAGRLPWGRFVALEGGSVVGWIAASPTSGRACYAGVVEHSVYVDTGSRGRGVGSTLLDAFLTEAPRNGVWTVQGAMFPENLASIGLHERAGFRLVGRRQRIAQLDGHWRDTVLYELRLTEP